MTEKRKKLAIILLAVVAVLAVLALAFAVYMGLTVIFVDAVANQPPTI